VSGPAGLFYDNGADVLYVASTADNAIFKIPHAGTAGPSSGTGKLVFTDPHLLGPLALALAPNGHLLTSNGEATNPDPAHPSEIVEFRKTGHFIGEYNIHQNGAEHSVLRHPHRRRGKEIQTTTSFVCDEGNFIVELTQDLCPPAALARQPAAQESRVAVSRVSSHTSASTKASPPDLIGPQHSDVPARESSLRNRPE
jgi:hypothetical protein